MRYLACVNGQVRSAGVGLVWLWFFVDVGSTNRYLRDVLSSTPRISHRRYIYDIRRYGTGNIPVDTQPEILHALREAVERGVVIVTITQCFKGRAEPNYATGRALMDNGVVCGYAVPFDWLELAPKLN